MNRLVRVNPIPCKFCGVMFSGKSFRRYNCDEHYRQKRPEIEMERSRKISEAKIGTKRKPFSPVWIENLRKSAKRGEKSYRWKGGVTPEHDRIRKSAQYVEWRNKVFEKDNHTCQGCGKRGGDHHAHHIKPFSRFPDLRFDVSNGQTLCVKCHRKTDTYGNGAKQSKPIGLHI